MNEVGRSKGEGEGKDGRTEVERVSQHDVRVRVKENTKMESRESSVEKHQPNTAGKNRINNTTKHTKCE